MIGLGSDKNDYMRIIYDASCMAAVELITSQQGVERQGNNNNESHDNDDVAIMMMVVMIRKMVRMMTTPMTT